MPGNKIQGNKEIQGQLHIINELIFVNHATLDINRDSWEYPGFKRKISNIRSSMENLHLPA